MAQHKTPCNECPFRRISMRGYLGGNHPQSFTVLANHDGNFPCHKTMKRAKPAQCAGRATMWANQCKVSRDDSVPSVLRSEKVFAHIGEFIKHHEVTISVEQLMGLEPLDE